MAEDFNKLRLTTRKMVKTPYKQGWQFRIEIEGEPIDFDIYVKEASHGPTEVNTEEDQYGGQTLTWPTGSAPVELALTLRDHEDERVAKWFDAWSAKVVFADGTVGLPYGSDGYVKKVKRYSLVDDGRREELRETWEMYPIKRGDVTESREDAKHLEFTAVFRQFRS